MKAWGIGLIAAGVLVALLALLLDTTIATPAVPSFDGIGGIAAGRTHNLGLLQTQLLTFMGGCALFLAGVVLSSAGRLEALLVDRAPVALEVNPRAVIAAIAENEEEREQRLAKADATFNVIIVVVIAAIVVLGGAVWLLTSARG